MIIPKKLFWTLVILYVVSQIIMILFTRVPLVSDSLRYYQLAMDCLQKSTFYPAPHNDYDPYITAPVYINYLILLLSVHASVKMVYLSNLIISCVMMFMF